jgi:DNA mismatch repair protein MutL
MEAYSGRLMKGRFPVAVVFVTLPADQVDVNVHPTKNQVRFAEARGIFELTTAALSRALASTGRSLSRIGTYHGPDVQPVLQAPVDLGRPTVFAREAAITVAGDSALPGTPAIQEDLWPADNGLTRWAIIGLLHGTYVICEGEAGLVLVDQHAAHERVVYERLKQAAASGRPVSQRLLIPEVMELTHRQAAALVAVVDALQDIGFDVEPFGGTSFALRAVPAVLADKAVGPMITDLADQIAESGRPADMGQLLEESLRLMACHHAIRAGQALGPAEMKRLLEQLAACTDPAHCPHGRPTWIVIDRAEIERRFGRRGPGVC